MREGAEAVTERRVFGLVHPEARRRAMAAVAEAPEGWRIVIEPQKRTLDQNSKFHALCSDMAGQPWYGKARNLDDWKTLFVSGHTIATGGVAEIITGLEGELVNIRESTARMSKARGSSLIEYTLAHCAMNGIAA